MANNVRLSCSLHLGFEVGIGYKTPVTQDIQKYRPHVGRPVLEGTVEGRIGTDNRSTGEYQLSGNPFLQSRGYTSIMYPSRELHGPGYGPSHPLFFTPSCRGFLSRLSEYDVWRPVGGHGHGYLCFVTPRPGTTLTLRVLRIEGYYR